MLRTADYKRNHVASKCYLNGWTDPSGVLIVGRRRTMEAAPAKPSAVGDRNHFWGRDPQVRAAAEAQASAIESRASVVLPLVPEHWPIRDGRDDFFVLLQLVALHMVRTPQWVAWAVARREEGIARRLPELRSQFGSRTEDVLAHLRSDRELADLVLGQIPKMASLLGSMHMSLIRFDRPWLVTSDQPVAPIPIDGEPTIRSIPDGGFLSIAEIRFPLDPHHALVFLWADEPDDGPPIGGTHRMAAILNVSTAVQADAEVFLHPATAGAPVFVVPPFAQTFTAPIGPEICPGYSTQAAVRSRRRAEAWRIVNDMIENEITDRITVAAVHRAAA